MNVKKKLITLIEILLVICIAVSGYKIGSYYLAGHQFTKEHEELKASIWEETTDEHKKSEEKPNLVAQLKKDYPDMVGWIKIEGTSIDFPVVQGKDNDYYLNHTYKGEYHPFGEVFMDKDDKPDYSDQNTVLYGHNVRSGYVFHELEQFKDQSFRDAHPSITIDTVDGKKTYDIVAVYTASAYAPYRKPNYSEAEWEKFRAWVKEKNRLNETLPGKDAHILTLSTCSDEEDRLVVHAVLRDEK